MTTTTSGTPPITNGGTVLFTPAELKVLESLALGKTNKEIADDLYLGVSTVKKHVENMMNKSGLHRRTQLALVRIRPLDQERGSTL